VLPIIVVVPPVALLPVTVVVPPVAVLPLAFILTPIAVVVVDRAPSISKLPSCFNG
jgi:hypothetical protein